LETSRKSWVTILFSVAERIASRGSAAVITLLLALASSPEAVGQYATVILSITIYQALTDGVIRQIGVEAWNYRNGRQFLRRSSRISGLLGTFIVSGFLLVVCLPNFSWTLMLHLLPLVFVPLVSSGYLELLTRAQRTGDGWKRIAKAQMWGSLLSVLVAVPLLPVWGVGAAAIQVLLAELCFLVLIHLRPTTVPRTELRIPLWRRYYWPTAFSSVLGWSQSQLERLVLVVLASPGTLGIYSLAVAIARSASDAITAGLVNATRAQISAAVDEHQREIQLRRGLFAGMSIALAMQVMISLVSVFVLPRFLEEHWSDSIKLAPLFACTGVIAAIVWVTSAYIIACGKASMLIYAQGIGVVLSVVCGLVLNVSLFAGAYACIVRDLIGLCLRLILIRRSLKGDGFRIIVAFLLSSLIVGLASMLVTQGSWVKV
jgi:O-antigen/teichoic acid export membrane protein